MKHYESSEHDGNLVVGLGWGARVHGGDRQRRRCDLVAAAAGRSVRASVMTMPAHWHQWLLIAAFFGALLAGGMVP